jgi:hypothetical protein
MADAAKTPTSKTAILRTLIIAVILGYRRAHRKHGVWVNKMNRMSAMEMVPAEG